MALQTADGSIVPKPGSVQSAIDSVASGGGGLITLNPSEEYVQDSSFPWTIEKDVTIDFNGATLKGSGSDNSTDIIHVGRRGRVFDPLIDLYDGGDGYDDTNTFTGTVFKVDTGINGPIFADGTTVWGGTTFAAGGSGTLFHFITNTHAFANAEYISHAKFQHNVTLPPEDWSFSETIGTCALLDTTPSGDGTDNWINGAIIGGQWRDPHKGVVQSGKEQTSGFNQQNFNIFNVQTQADSASDSAWEIQDPTWARGNIWRGMPWDTNNYANGNAWHIHSTYNETEAYKGCVDNHLIAPGIFTDDVESDSPSDNYLTRWHDLTTWTV